MEVVEIVNQPEQANGQQPKTNNFLVILLSSLLIISCLIAGFFAYQTQNLVKELTKLQITPSPKATIVPSPTPLETPVATGSATPISSPVACTMEARICPDGSAIGRTGPNCEFAPCPTSRP